MGIWSAAAVSHDEVESPVAGSFDAASPSELIRDSQELMREFLGYVDPNSLSSLSLPEDENAERKEELPISSWNVLYASLQDKSPISPSTDPPLIQPSINVRSHPSPTKHLFSVQSVIPDVNARQFWTLMADSCNRSLWDGSVEAAETKRWLGKEPLQEEERRNAEALGCRIEYLKFGSIMLVAGKRDMTLLSADTRLPDAEGAGRVRLLSTSCSIHDPSLPPKKGYNRFRLNIGGFLVEDLGCSGVAGDTVGQAAIRVTQVSDLGEMAAWVPASVVRMVASTMVPRSVASIGKIAARIQIPHALLVDHSRLGITQGSVQQLSLGSWQTDRMLPAMLLGSSLSNRIVGSSPSSPSATASLRMTPSTSQEEMHCNEESTSSTSSSSILVSQKPSLTLQPLSTRIPSSSSLKYSSTHSTQHDGSQGLDVSGIYGGGGASSDGLEIMRSCRTPSVTIRLADRTSESLVSPCSEENSALDENMAADAESQKGDDIDTMKTLLGDTPLLERKSQDFQSFPEAGYELEKRFHRMSCAFMEEQGMEETKKTKRDSQQVSALLAEAFEQEIFGNVKRASLSPAQIEARRLSVLFLAGTDVLAMGIAPGARQSLLISERREGSLNLASGCKSQGMPDVDEEGGESTGQKRHSPPKPNKPCSHSSINSSSSFLSSPTRSPLLPKLARLHRKRYGSSSAEPMASRSYVGASKMKDQYCPSSKRQSPSHELPKSSTATYGDRKNSGSDSWISAVRDVPYIVGLALIGLAWAGAEASDDFHGSRDMSGDRRETRDPECKDTLYTDEQIGAAVTVMPTASAIATAQNILHKSATRSQTANRSKTACSRPRPSSYYNPQDSKLHPFPASLDKVGAAALPPIGIAAEEPTSMECEPAKLKEEEEVGVTKNSSWWFY